MQDLWPSGGVIAFSFKFRGFVSRSYLARGSKGTMRRLLLASVAVAAAAPAMAADMALKAPLAPIVDPWVGPYVGGNLGASWGNIGTTTSVAPSTFTGGAITGTFPGGTTSTSLHPNGVIGGGQAGYVGRIAPHWLWGIEADYQWSGEQASGHGAFSGSPACGDPTPASCFSTDTTDITARLSRFGTLRFRTGFESNGLWFYGTLGPAFGTVEVSGTNTLSVTGSFTGVGPSLFSYSASNPFSYSTTKVGGSGGVGIEGIIDPGNHWRWKAEFLYLDLGSIGGGTFGGVTVNTGRFTDDILRFGINYKFGNDCCAPPPPCCATK